MKSKSKKITPAAIQSGADLRKYRQALGMTQAQFAERYGFSVNYISMLEQGVRAVNENFRRRLRLFEMENN